MKCFKHSKSGETHRVPNKHAHQYQAEDGWQEVADIGETSLTAEEEERAKLAVMEPVERFQILMNEIKELKVRLDELERGKS